MVDQPARPVSRGLRPVFILVAALCFLAAIWSVLWLFLSNRAVGAVETWLVAERKAGRDWTCPDRRVDGYPFALRLHCSRPTFHGEVMGRIAGGSLEALEAGLRFDRPRQLAVALRGPLILRSEAEDFDFTASWADLALTVDNLGGRAVSGGFAASRLAVTLQTPTQGDLNLRAARARGQAAPAATGPGDIGFSVDADALDLPTADPVPGLEGPTDASAQGVLARADLLRTPTRGALEAWRTSGGALQLAALSIGKGSLHGMASGTLSLDAAHRPAGKLDAAVAGFEPVAERYGIPLAGARIGGLIANLLTGGKAPPAAAPGSVQLPLLLQDGALSVGPFRTGVRLGPLY